MVIRKAERANDPDMLTVLGAPALEHDMIELVAGGRKRVVTASMPRTTRLPRVTADLARSVPTLSKLITILATASRTMSSFPTLAWEQTACYSRIIGEFGRFRELKC
jgi:hypothetical protein